MQPGFVFPAGGNAETVEVVTAVALLIVRLGGGRAPTGFEVRRNCRSVGAELQIGRITRCHGTRIHGDVGARHVAGEAALDCGKGGRAVSCGGLGGGKTGAGHVACVVAHESGGAEGGFTEELRGRLIEHGLGKCGLVGGNRAGCVRKRSLFEILCANCSARWRELKA